MTRTPARIAASLTALLAFCALSPPLVAQDASSPEPRWSLVIHGGAGTLTRDAMTPEREAEYEAALQAALDAGAQVLRDGGAAMDAVEAVIVRLEDDPKFNAGRGAVFTWDGRNELDAAVMDGRDRSAGAVTGVTSVKNPIRLAREVMADGRHVFLSGAGAEQFARDHALETAGPEWFATDARREALERMKAEQVSALDVDRKFGTVGAVALDMAGNLAAGTSTGGMTGKRWGRIGDAPVIGAGTYADNRSCAVSATGWGEYFIRVGVAQEICTRLRLSSETSLEDLADESETGGDVQLTDALVQRVSDAVLDEVADLGGDGGVIVVAPSGAAIYSFNTSGMYRGRATSEGISEVAIFGEETEGSRSAVEDDLGALDITA